MNQLSRLHVDGFRSIKSADIEFRPLNVLIGPNGAGKSNLVDFFRMLNYTISRGIQSPYLTDRGPASHILHFGPKRTPVINVEVEFTSDRGSNFYRFSLAHVHKIRIANRPDHPFDPIGYVYRPIQSRGHHRGRDRRREKPIHEAIRNGACELAGTLHAEPDLEQKCHRGPSMSKRLLIYCEGQTEEMFVERLLRNHLVQFGVQVERAIETAFGEPRFKAYLQRHELEALLLADMSALEFVFHRHKSAIERLANDIAAFANAEVINHSVAGHPAARLAAAIPGYEDLKASRAYFVLAQANWRTVRNKCPRFDAWLSHWEDWGRSS